MEIERLFNKLSFNELVEHEESLGKKIENLKEQQLKNYGKLIPKVKEAHSLKIKIKNNMKELEGKLNLFQSESEELVRLKSFIFLAWDQMKPIKALTILYYLQQENIIDGFDFPYDRIINNSNALLIFALIKRENILQLEDSGDLIPFARLLDHKKKLELELVDEFVCLVDPIFTPLRTCKITIEANNGDAYKNFLRGLLKTFKPKALNDYSKLISLLEEKGFTDFHEQVLRTLDRMIVNAIVERDWREFETNFSLYRVAYGFKKVRLMESLEYPSVTANKEYYQNLTAIVDIESPLATSINKLYESSRQEITARLLSSMEECIDVFDLLVCLNQFAAAEGVDLMGFMNTVEGFSRQRQFDHHGILNSFTFGAGILTDPPHFPLPISEIEIPRITN